VLVLLLVELGVPLHRNDKLELAPGHPLELPLQFIRIPAEQLDDLGVLDAVKQLDGFGVVHHARHRAVERLSAEGGPDSGTKRELGGGTLESNERERNVVGLLTLLFVAEWIGTV